MSALNNTGYNIYCRSAQVLITDILYNLYAFHCRVILGIALHKSLDFPTVILILFLSNAGYFLVWYIALKVCGSERETCS